MEIYTALNIGSAHPHFCEDFLVQTQIGERLRLWAVLDGCTMGEESYFASALAGKLLRKIAVEQDFLRWKQPEALPLEALLEQICARFFSEYKSLANQLLLKTNELLTTLVLCLYDVEASSGEILVAGDGVVCVDGRITEFEQGNKPNYFGYHLQDPFSDWYKRHTQRVSVRCPRDLSLATDGVFSFKRFDSAEREECPDPAAYLLVDTAFAAQPQMLAKKLILLEKEYGLRPMDDVAIVRVRFAQQPVSLSTPCARTPI